MTTALKLASRITPTILLLCLLFAPAAWSQSWPMSGQGASDLRYQPNETHINPNNVASLTKKWVFTTGSDVSATPAVVGNVVYVPDWSGHLYAIAADTGAPIWSHQIAEYDGVSGSVARGSPAFVNNKLIFGDLIGGSHNGASIMAVNASSGALLWITKVDPHPAAIITGPVAIAGNTAFVGVSSGEESFADRPGYNCCTFR